MATLFHTVRTVQDPMERKQVKCVLIGVCFSHIPIAHSLYIVLAEPAKFVEGAVTWPMFGASLIVTIAFAIGMTRYRLLELEKIITSGVGYFLLSFLAGFMYYAVVFIGTLFYSRFISSPMLQALTVSTTALVFVLALDAARSRIQRALDRRFSHSKSQLDQTLQQMSQAVAQLVDPPALAQRLLTTVSETLGIPRGAIYLRHDDGSFALAAKLGQARTLPDLPADAPLIQGLASGLGLECPLPMEGPLSPAQRQLRELGGEIAQPLRSEGKLLAIVILGPKETPYRAEDWNLLSAFAQITIVTLDNAAQHRAIDHLNHELQAKVDKIAEQQRRILALQSQLHRQTAEPVVKKPEPRPAPPPPEADGVPLANPSGIVGSGPVVRQLLTLVRKVAATDAVVLLRGESGTGKELLARAVHESSPRAGKPYVKVHCAALSASLLESELFGHVKGAFTGAHRDKVGRFELANGGTLFLDEIGDISLDVQTKLLRVLQEKTIERVGASEPLNVDVRIIAATHQNLEALIRQGRFREDLFYRLNVFPIEVPPLRDRREDIPELATFFIEQSSKRCKRNVTQIDDDALALLKGQAWPGNIRQLENVIERAVVIAEGEMLSLQDMPGELFQSDVEANENGVLEPMPAAVERAPGSNFRSQREQFEREQLERALSEAAGNKSEAARILGIARSTLVSRLKKLGME
jgi:transcriptional regulator with GAF, ATPase, and Fis domain